MSQLLHHFAQSDIVHSAVKVELRGCQCARHCGSFAPIGIGRGRKTLGPEMNLELTPLGEIERGAEDLAAAGASEGDGSIL